MEDMEGWKITNLPTFQFNSITVNPLLPLPR
jgi:hypothetical protein